ncbi:hypothetical protein IC235_00620 [Hymenobacter sp. BT664]|uniref:Uncharacterized protein n=1 Tax=Hymenobacter montanus TaxID=2771359 RepID=A0A927GHJ7_9BACT|nr:hypothetical protein [Hymenobacter montanus]MBD2766390.1 hypothetical protein [Hymenobacter montanus]
MTTPQLILAVLVLGTAILTSSAAGATPNPQSTPAEAGPVLTRTVTVVKSKAPWYAFNFLLVREFNKVVPVYQQVNGLEFKAFHSIATKEGKFFGGIYLWASEAQARTWYSPTWFADVERKRGRRPTVDYYALVDEARFVGPTFDYRAAESSCVTVFAHALTPAQRPQCLLPQAGLLRTYVVRETNGQEGALLLFATADKAASFLKKQQVQGYEWFTTPVLLNNAR